MKKSVVVLALLLASVASVASARCLRPFHCYGCDDAVVMKEVCKVVCEPQTEMVERKVIRMERVQEERICKKMVAETQMKEVTVTVCRPVTETVEQEYTVMVPVKEQRTRKVLVRKPVDEIVERCVRKVVCCPETYTKLVSCYTGCYRAKACHCGCFSRCVCVPETELREVECTRYVRGVVEEKVPVTVRKWAIEEEERTYEVTVYRPEVRTRTCQVTRMERVQEVRQIPTVVCVPVEYKKMVTVLKPVEEIVQVPVTTYVRKTVVETVPVRVCNARCWRFARCCAPCCNPCYTSCYAPCYTSCNASVCDVACGSAVVSNVVKKCDSCGDNAQNVEASAKPSITAASSVVTDNADAK